MIVIPMVGRSRRFLDAGYPVPKHQLMLWGRTVFAHAVSSFSGFFEQEEILIVSLRQDGLSAFVSREMHELGVRLWRLVELPQMTLGQADTVMQGLQHASAAADQPITIFNIDTFRPGFEYPTNFDVTTVDGYLECFEGTGANWSNVIPSEAGDCHVQRTSEKMQDSQYCCTGLYYFRRAGDMIEACVEALEGRERTGSAGEVFVAPLYNSLISNGMDIRFSIVQIAEIVFCGVPEEYEALKLVAAPSNPLRAKP